MLTALFLICLLGTVIGLFFKFTGLMIKIVYLCCVGLPCALVLWALGLVCFCTLLLIPIGKWMFRTAGWILMPL